VELVLASLAELVGGRDRSGFVGEGMDEYETYWEDQIGSNQNHHGGSDGEWVLESTPRIVWK
jgi:hypothetical protein